MDQEKPALLPSCDTLVALPGATGNGSVLFAKNSDRPPNECQRLVEFPHQVHPEGNQVKCTYIEIPQCGRRTPSWGHSRTGCGGSSTASTSAVW